MTTRFQFFGTDSVTMLLLIICSSILPMTGNAILIAWMGRSSSMLEALFGIPKIILRSSSSDIGTKFNAPVFTLVSRFWSRCRPDSRCSVATEFRVSVPTETKKSLRSSAFRLTGVGVFVF